MSRPQKIITIALWILAVVAMVGVLALKTLPSGRDNSVASATAGNSMADLGEPTIVSAKDLPARYDAPKFDLIDQNGKTFSSTDLAGNVWVADFIFTSCASLCPLMSTRMAGLQKQLPDSIKLISFSVDPQHDTPAALLAYSEKYEAQAGRWTFLTGEPKAALAVVAGMKLGFLPATATDPIVHSSYFVLVDGTGKVRGAYDSNIDNRVADLIHDTKLLADENSAGNGAAK